jgi:hypothetical protein
MERGSLSKVTIRTMRPLVLRSARQNTGRSSAVVIVKVE